MKVKVFDISLMHNNCIVVSDDERNCVVIDIPYGSTEVEQYVTDNHLNVQGILLTHGHFDHVGGVKHFVDSVCCGNIDVYCNDNDWLLANNASHNKWRCKCDDCYPTQTVTDGELSIGNFHFQVVATPFHTMGSVVYLLGDHMFSGDTLFAQNIGRSDFEESQPALIVDSLGKLKRLQKNYIVIPGHGESTTLDSEKENNPYFKL